MNIKKQNAFPYLFSIVMLFVLCGQVIAGAEPKRPRLHIVRPQRPDMATLPVAAAVPMQCAASALPTADVSTVVPSSKVEVQEKPKKHKSKQNGVSISAIRKSLVRYEPCSTVSKRVKANKHQFCEASKSHDLNVSGLDCRRFIKLGRKKQKSLAVCRVQSFKGLITHEDDGSVIIDDPSNRMRLKIDKAQPVIDISQTVQWARGVRYAQRVRDWFKTPSRSLRAHLMSIGQKPKRGVYSIASLEKSYSMHLFSKLVDQYLCYGKRFSQRNGTYKIVINGAVAKADEEEFKPCVFEYVFDGQSHECFHRNMRLVSDEAKKRTQSKSEKKTHSKQSVRAPMRNMIFPDGLCLDDI
ncbi:MAG TPA: hypothetical protein PKD74_04400 [Candidatus Dependentiae bacterium]|nr:hypothetical protein [Candidatus Dependentiae bacterium]